MASSSNLPAFFILLPSPISCILPDWSKTFQKVTDILLVDVTLSCCHRNVKEMSLSLWQNSLKAKPTRSAPSSREKYSHATQQMSGNASRAVDATSRTRANLSGLRSPHNSHGFSAYTLLQT